MNNIAKMNMAIEKINEAREQEKQYMLFLNERLEAIKPHLVNVINKTCYMRPITEIPQHLTWVEASGPFVFVSQEAGKADVLKLRDVRGVEHLVPSYFIQGSMWDCNKAARVDIYKKKYWAAIQFKNIAEADVAKLGPHSKKYEDELKQAHKEHAEKIKDLESTYLAAFQKAKQDEGYYTRMSHKMRKLVEGRGNNS